MSAASFLSDSKPIRVAVTGAAGQIAYSLFPLLCSGSVFGAKQHLILHCIDIPVPAILEKLEGVKMELDDCAYELLDEVICTADLAVGFKDVDVAIFLGAFPRREGMERKDLLDKNAGIFKDQGKALGQYAKPTVKSLVVGNPANTNCAVLVACADKLDPRNFSALTRLDHNRATHQIAAKLGVPVGKVKNVTIWGNHSSTQVPDVSTATVDGKSASSAINDEAWLADTFIPTVQKRGAAVIAKRGLSSAASAANAIADHMRDWLLGTSADRHVSMAVVSDGSYGVPSGLVFSYPVTCNKGDWKIVTGQKIGAELQKRLDVTKQELLSEQKTAFAALGIALPASSL